MAKIPGTNVASPIAPFTTDDQFPTHDAIYGKGGQREVATIAERDAIPSARLTEGCTCYVAATEKTYRWKSNAWVDDTPEIASDASDISYTPSGSSTPTNVAAALDGKASTSALAEGLAWKQGTINDLEAIRSGAGKGATSVQGVKMEGDDDPLTPGENGVVTIPQPEIPDSVTSVLVNNELVFQTPDGQSVKGKVGISTGADGLLHLTLTDEEGHTYSSPIAGLRVNGNALQYSNDGETWTTVQTFGTLAIKYVQASDPASGDEGDLALVGSTNAYTLKVYVGGSWVSVGDFGTLDLTSDGITIAGMNKTLTDELIDKEVATGQIQNHYGSSARLKMTPDMVVGRTYVFSLTLLDTTGRFIQTKVYLCEKESGGATKLIGTVPANRSGGDPYVIEYTPEEETNYQYIMLNGGNYVTQDVVIERVWKYSRIGLLEEQLGVVEELSEEVSTIKDNVVIVENKNLIDPAAFAPNKYWESATQAVNSNVASASPKIDIEGISKLYFNRVKLVQKMFFLDSENTVVKSINNTFFNIPSEYDNFTIEVPSGAKYMLFSVYDTFLPELVMCDASLVKSFDDSLYMKPRRTSRIPYGINLLEGVGYYDGVYLGGNDTVNARVDCISTDFIDVSGIKKLMISRSVNSYGGFGLFYKADKTTKTPAHLSYALETFAADLGKDEVVIDVPEGYQYFRLNLNKEHFLSGDAYLIDYDKVNSLSSPWIKLPSEVGSNLHGKTVVFLGDSYTRQGRNANSELGTHHWTSLLAQHFGWNFTVLGASGATYSNKAGGVQNPAPNNSLARYVDSIANMVPKPDLVICWGGANDASFSPYGNFDNIEEVDNTGAVPTYADRGTLCGGLRYVCEAIHQLAPNAHIFLLGNPQAANLGVPIRKMGQSPDKYVADIKTAISDAARFFCATYIDIGESNYNQYNAKAGMYAMDDNLHPNWRGCMLLADYLIRKLSMCYNVGMTTVEGTLRDGNGNAIANATIKFKFADQDRYSSYNYDTVTTGVDGKYEANLIPDTYAISVSGYTLDVSTVVIKQSTLLNLVGTASS